MTTEVTIWCSGEHATTVQRIIDLMGSSITPIGLGSARPAEIGELSRQLDCPVEDDFRKLLIDRPAAFVLTTTIEGIDPSALEATNGARLLSIEPIAASLDELPNNLDLNVTMLAEFMHCPGWHCAADPSEVIGTVQMINFTSLGPHSEASLFARLYDAWQVALRFGDMPESIDASLTGPLSEPPETLRGLTGHMSIHARNSTGSTTTLQLSDRAGISDRYLQVIGDQAHLAIGNQHYILAHSSGELIDRSAPPEHHDTFVDLMVRQWRQLLDQSNGEATGRTIHDLEVDRRIITCCLASLLSSRTGEPESPQTLIEMNRGL